MDRLNVFASGRESPGGSGTLVFTHCTMATTIAKQYTRLRSLWPKDALRPNLPFTRAIEHHGLPYGVQPSALAAENLQPSASVLAKPTTTSTSAPQNLQREQAQVNALYSLLEDRYSNKYALSSGVLKPTSAPEHYSNLMEEIARAPQKSWWQAKLDEWKMKVRWT
ncbi:hypothetical protein BKA66DRAFT_478502 [Pyrenochaeta sp. MPI-SDFR-AT-0127]|nr:hypothetical protein BKA66DRAFT_478502 [Pyrenochaeta sp. MPI-SDFR-AT-0127]